MILQTILSRLRALSGRVSDNLAGIGLMIASTAFVAVMYAVIRKVPGGLHPFELVFFRNLFGVMILVLTHWRSLGKLFRTQRIRLHMLRGALNLSAMLMFFTAILVTPLAEVTALGFTAPLFASLLAMLVLKERPGMYRLAVMALGFVGMLTILRPGLNVIQAGSLLILGSSTLWAATMMVIKTLTRTDSSATITVYMGVFMTPVSLIPALFVWQWPDLRQLAWMMGVALLGTLGQVSLVQSFRFAELTAVLPLDFFKLIWGVLLGYYIFAEVPDGWTLLGGVVIFASTTYLTIRESRPGSGAK